MLLHKGMFLYPWDIEKNFAKFSEQYLATGCDTVVPALSYHHGTVLSPRNQRFYTMKEAFAQFNPNKTRYSEIVPIEDRQHAKTSYALREWSESQGINFTAWVVYLHNSSLGEQFPELTVKDAWGNHHLHTLCPSNSKVKVYLTELTEDICKQFSPTHLAAESLTPRTPFHGAHHEIANIFVSETIQWLLSICFCDDCKKQAQKCNIDVNKLEMLVAQLLKEETEQEISMRSSGEARILSLLVSYPILYEYIQIYQQTVSEVIKSVIQTARSNNTEVQMMPSSTPYNIDRLYREYFDLEKNKHISHYLPLVYDREESFLKVKAIIGRHNPKSKISMAITLHPERFSAKSEFLDFITQAIQQDPCSIYYYNYSIASKERLLWVAEANGLKGMG